jgi:hypothetical protein
MMPIEFLFFALLFLTLDVAARQRGTDGGYLRSLRVWAAVQGVLFLVFTVLVYALEKEFMTPFGALYLLSVGLAAGMAIRMRRTVEAVVR